MSFYDWHEDAACLDVDPEMFYPENGHNEYVPFAKSICNRCEVKDRCLADALRRNYIDDWGIAGGMTRDQRNALRRKMAVAA